MLGLLVMQVVYLLPKLRARGNLNSTNVASMFQCVFMVQYASVAGGHGRQNKHVGFEPIDD